MRRPICRVILFAEMNAIENETKMKIPPEATPQPHPKKKKKKKKNESGHVHLISMGKCIRHKWVKVKYYAYMPM